MREGSDTPRTGKRSAREADEHGLNPNPQGSSEEFGRQGYREDPTAAPPLDLTAEHRLGPLSPPEAVALPETVAPTTEEWGASADLAHERLTPPPAERAPEVEESEREREEWGASADLAHWRQGPPKRAEPPPEREDY